MKNQKIILLLIGAVLMIVGLIRPNISNILKPKPDNDPVVVVAEPTDENLRKACDAVISIFQTTDASSIDANRLAQLYMDMATLIELDGDDTVIKTTEEIKQANSLSGLMLHLDIKGKYPGLSDAAKAVIVAGIGDDAVNIDSTTRTKAAESFRALAWACKEGSK